MNNKFNVFENIEPPIDIVVCTKHNASYVWFISDREYWFLDYEKFCKSFDPLDTDYSTRFDIGILDESSFEVFMKKASSYICTTAVLEEGFGKYIPLSDWDTCSHLFPSIFIDFDSKKLYSVYQESMSFENYVPKKWEGFYEDFYEIIPQHEKYWVIDGKDHFKELVSQYNGDDDSFNKDDFF